MTFNKIKGVNHKLRVCARSNSRPLNNDWCQLVFGSPLKTLHVFCFVTCQMPGLYRKNVHWTNRKTVHLNSLVSSLLQEWWSTSLEDTRWLITLMVRRDRPMRLTSLHHSEEWAWHTTWRSWWESNFLLLTATTVMVRMYRTMQRFYVWSTLCLWHAVCIFLSLPHSQIKGFFFFIYLFML